MTGSCQCNSRAHAHGQEHEHNHNHGHSHEHGDVNLKLFGLRLALSLILTVLAGLLPIPPAFQIAIFVAAYLLAGYNVVLSALKNITKGRVFDENFLMSVATIGAFAIGEYTEAVAVMLFYGVGELLQDMAVDRSKKSITSLMDIRPDSANIVIDGKITAVSPETLKIGDVIVVRPGEKVPLDGVVEEGDSFCNTAALTGESKLREIGPKSEVLSGFVNQSGTITVRVTKPFSESTASKIIDMVKNSGEKKAESEKFITKFAAVYTPIVVGVALLTALVPPMFLGFHTFSGWLYKALTFLIISCPCALVISIPISFFGGIGGASKKGVLVKGGNYLEALGKLSCVVFDKTGTLTKGTFTLTETICAPGVEKTDLLRFAALCEAGSTHPIAQSVLSAYGEETDEADVMQRTELGGFGLAAETVFGRLLAGNEKLMQKEGVSYEKNQSTGTVVYVAKNGAYQGCLVIKDQLKENTPRALAMLRQQGVEKTVMLTGDNGAVAAEVAKSAGVDEFFYNLLPADKVAKLEDVMAKTPAGKKVAFVGDGMNDAPVLARADIGIAMGAIGSDAAIEAADVVLMNDDPQSICAAVKVARKTRAIVIQNIAFALGVKIVILILSLFGITSMWFAIFADVGVALISVVNALRAMR